MGRGAPAGCLLPRVGTDEPSLARAVGTRVSKAEVLFPFAVAGSIQFPDAAVAPSHAWAVVGLLKGLYR